MNINIEIGTEEEKKLIKEEINYVLSDFKNENFEIVVPIDFDKHIQSKLGDDRFISNRSELNQLVMGKLIGENHLVLNPKIYTEYFNEQIRANYYSHEFHHILNKKRLVLNGLNPKDKKLISLINFMFDEYSSNRFAFDRTKLLYSFDQTVEDYHSSIATGHFENFSNPQIYSSRIDSLIVEFQTRRISIMEFVGKIEPLIERFSVELVSYFSIVDSLAIDPELVNPSIMSLIEILRESYRNGISSFENQIPRVEEYLRIFGISVENHENGLYYNVFERE